MKGNFLNPFNEGVTYVQLKEVLKKEKKTIEEYCKGKLSDSEIEFLKKELTLINK